MATTVELEDLRNDLGDTSGAFSVEELERLLERSQDSEGTQQHYVALAMGVFQLLTQAARFADYTVNEAQERKSEIWRNLEGTYKLLLLRPDVSAALGPDSNGAGTIQRRKFKYTKTRTSSGEYTFPDLLP